MEASNIINKMALASSMELSFYYWDMYINYIIACGWTDEELDCELLYYIDNNWEEYQWEN
jgi:hypothetical protein